MFGFGEITEVILSFWIRAVSYIIRETNGYKSNPYGMCPTEVNANILYLDDVYISVSQEAPASYRSTEESGEVLFS